MNVLILGLSERIQFGLQVLLTHMPGLDLIQTADTCQVAQGMMNGHPLGLVLVDLDQPESEVTSFVSNLKQQKPQPYCIGIVAKPSRTQVARRTGVDTVLVRGFSQEELLTRVLYAQKMELLQNHGVEFDPW